MIALIILLGVAFYCAVVMLTAWLVRYVSGSVFDYEIAFWPSVAMVVLFSLLVGAIRGSVNVR